MTGGDLRLLGALEEDVGSFRARISRNVANVIKARYRQTVILRGGAAGLGLICILAEACEDSSPETVCADTSVSVVGRENEAAADQLRLECLPYAADCRAARAIRLEPTCSRDVALTLRASLASGRLVLPVNVRLFYRECGKDEGANFEVEAPGQYACVNRKTALQYTNLQETNQSRSAGDSRRCNPTAFKKLTETFDLFRGHTSHLGATPSRGILLSGPPGVGKSSAVREAAKYARATLVEVGADELRHASIVAGSAESRLRESFRLARERSVSSTVVVFLDELDTYCGRRADSRSGNRVVTQLVGLMDELNQADEGREMFVVAATNRVNELDLALRRPGRFDCELELAAPDAGERYDVAFSLLKDSELSEYVSRRSLGFVAADLCALIAEAFSIRDSRRETKLSIRHLQEAFRRVRGSATRAAIGWIRNSTTTWSDIGGAAQAKYRLRAALQWPAKHASTWKALGLDSPRGILLQGPPGTSKTTLVKAAANEAGVSLFSLSGAEMFSSFLGEAEKTLRRAFFSARSAAPSILFLDEIDSLVGKRGAAYEGNSVRERVLSTLLNEMDGIVTAVGVLVVGATNRADMLDDALLRPGRFDYIVDVPLPDAAGRQEIFKIHLRKTPCADDINFEQLANMTVNWSGADIAAACREAAMLSLRKSIAEKSEFSVEHRDMLNILDRRI